MGIVTRRDQERPLFPNTSTLVVQVQHVKILSRACLGDYCSARFIEQVKSGSGVLGVTCRVRPRAASEALLHLHRDRWRLAVSKPVHIRPQLHQLRALPRAAEAQIPDPARTVIPSRPQDSSPLQQNNIITPASRTITSSLLCMQHVSIVPATSLYLACYSSQTHAPETSQRR
jgi:hypothetical protein